MKFLIFFQALYVLVFVFFFQAEDGIRDWSVTGVQTCALPISGGLGAQELPPAGIGVPDRCRWDAVARQDPPDRRGADTVTELEQFAPDPHVSPARVLPGHPHHQGGEDVFDRRPPGPVRVGPSSAYEV